MGSTAGKPAVCMGIKMKKWKIGIKDVGINILGAVIARAVFFSMNPIAIGYFGAAYTEKKYRIFLLLGMIIGMSTAMPVMQTVKYGLIMVVIGVVTALIEKRSKTISPTVMGIIAGVITAVFSLSNPGALMDREYLLLAVVEGLLVLALVNLFYLSIGSIVKGTRGQALGNEELISLAILAAAAVYAMPHFYIEGFSLTEAVTFLFILFMGYKYGAGAGAICGASCSMILCLADKNPGMIGIFCMMGICAGMFRELSRFASCIAFMAVHAAMGFFYDTALLDLVYIRGLLSAVVVFLVLPKRWTIYTSSAGRNGADGYPGDNMEMVAKRRLGEFADSFRRLSRTFHSLADTRTTFGKQDIDKIFDSLSERLCSQCGQCDQCCGQEGHDSYRTAASVLQAAKHRGAVLASDMPEDFAGKCVNFDLFLEETNRELAVAALNMNWNNRMAESREAIAGQLGEVADIIRNFARDICETREINDAEGDVIARILRMNHIDVKKIVVMERHNKKKEIYMTVRTRKGRCITTREAAAIVSRAVGMDLRPAADSKNIISRDYDRLVLIEDTNFKVLTGMARKNKEGEEVSGDNFSFMTLDNGEMVMTLADGMGCGQEAYAESESVVDLLEQFMEAGFSEKSAIRLINSILVLKSSRQSFSTLDMSIINLYTGMCEFIKFGASTTFIKRDGWVEAIQSTSLPVGVLNQMEMDDVTKKLYDGDLIIMVSDGIMDSIKADNAEKYMEDILMGIKSRNPKEISNLVLERVTEQSKEPVTDDMTVLAAGFWKR